MDKFFETQLDLLREKVNVVKAQLELVDDINEEIKQSKFPKIYYSGRVIGDVTDCYLQEHLNDNSSLTYIRGEHEYEDPDAICKEDRYFAIEIKTTCSEKTNTPVGSRTHANLGLSGRKNIEDHYHFYIFTKYHIETVDGRPFVKAKFISVGMLKPSDWPITASKKTNASRIKKETFNNQFKIIYRCEE